MVKKSAAAIRHAEHGTHLVYLVSAFLGTHSVYEMAAGILAVIMIASWFLHAE